MTNLKIEKEESKNKMDDLPFAWKIAKVHLFHNILGDITKGVTNRSKISNFCYHFAYVSQIETKNAKETLIDEH